MFRKFLRNRFGQQSGDREISSDMRGQGRGAGWGGRGLGRGAGGGGRGGGTKPGSGPGGDCVCTNCGHKEPHVAGVRCIDQVCPKCGTKMIRG